MQFRELMASIPESTKAELAPQLAKIRRAFVRQSQRDAEIVESIIRTLEHPGHRRLAEKLRSLIMKGTTNG
jgi:hypothetical protein